MFSSPTESSAKARRRNSHADGPQSSGLTAGNTRRLTSRQSSAATGVAIDEYPITTTTAPLSGRTADRSIKWHWVPQNGDILPRGRRFHSCVTIASKIFLFGGEQRAEDVENQNGSEKKKILLNDLVVFNTIHQVWNILVPSGKNDEVPKPRKGHSLTAWGSKIVLFGGAGNQTYLNDIWIYETQSQTSSAQSPSTRSPTHDTSPTSSSENKWKQLHPVVSLRTGEDLQFFGGSVPNGPPPRAYHTAVIHQDCLYVYGGYGFSSQTPDVEVWKLDLHTQEWIPINSSANSPIKPGRRYGHVACCFDHSMFVYGGQVRSCLNDNDVYRFNFTTAEWSLSPIRRSSTRRSGSVTPNLKSLPLPGAPCPRTYHSATLIESHGRWLIHGGSNEDQTFNDLHEFNIRNERWRPIPCPTPVQLEGHTLAIALTGVSYALLSIGGSASLASQALRVDILAPSLNASQWKIEEMIVPASAVPPLLDYIKETSGMLNEMNALRHAQRSVQEDRRNRRALVDKLSTDNEDLRLQVQEVTQKLELSLRESSTRYLNGGGSSPSEHQQASSSQITALKNQVNEKQREIDGLMNEVKRLQETVVKFEEEKKNTCVTAPPPSEDLQALQLKLIKISECMEKLRENAVTIMTASSCGMPPETAIKVVSMASNIILQSVDQVQEKFLNKRTGADNNNMAATHHQGQNLPPTRSNNDDNNDHSNVNRRYRPQQDQLNLKRLPTRSEIEQNEQNPNNAPKSAGRRSSQQSSRRSTPRQPPLQQQSDNAAIATATPESQIASNLEEGSTLSHPGVDVGLQAGKGKIKLFRSSRKRSANTTSNTEAKNKQPSPKSLEVSTPSTIS